MGTLGGGFSSHFCRQAVAVRRAFFFDIANINHRLGGNELQVFEIALAALWNIGASGRMSGLQFGQRKVNKFQLGNGVFVFGGGFFA